MPPAAATPEAKPKPGAPAESMPKAKPGSPDAPPPPAKKTPCEFVAPPTEWKRKVAKGKGLQMSVIEERAAAAVMALLDGYMRHARRELDVIDQAIGIAGANTAEECEEAVRLVDRIAHEMKSEAGSLGYPLITRIGSSLCDYIEAVPALDPSRLRTIAVLANAMKVVFAQDIKGEGGDSGKALLAGIEDLVAKTLGPARAAAAAK